MRYPLRVLFAAGLVALVAVAAVVTVRLTAATASVAAAIASTTRWVPAAGLPLAVPAPPQGSLALDAVMGGVTTHLAAADAAAVRPIASVTKTMTALVILDQHPLRPGEEGEVLTITQVDVADYLRVAAENGSFVPVRIGERFTERELLLGLMLPSANNLALTAARWIDDTVPAFVARLNARAIALGMAHTHFADPDGLSAATTSTAADLVLLGEAAVANEALLSVASSTTATMPDGTVVSNLDRLLVLEPGWIGMKTGWTPEAGGCLLFAVERTPTPGSAPLVLVGAVLGQPPDLTSGWSHPELGGAFDVARAAASTAFSGYAAVRVGPGSIPVTGRLSTPWSASTGLYLTGPDRVVLLRAGDSLTVTTSVAGITAPAQERTDAGAVTVTMGGTVVGTWTLVTASALEGPSSWWKLVHG